MASALYVPTSSSSGGVTAGAIVGDNPTPYAAAALTSASDSLTTGDLSIGDAGEFGSCAEFAIEFWFLPLGIPGADTSILVAPVSNSGATRQISLTFKSTGNLMLSVLDDTATLRSITSGSTMVLSVWTHVVLTAQGGNLTIYLNGVSDATSASWSTHSVRPIGSTAGSLDFSINGTSGGYYIAELAVYRVGLASARVSAHYFAGTGCGFRRHAPGERIIAILDAMSSRAPRSIQAGSRNVIPRYMSGQAPIEEIRRAVEAEDVDAGFFAAADGTLTFLADGHRSSSPYNTVQATFGDGGGAELPYLGFQMDYSEAFLINEWNVTRSAYGISAATTQTASDATSIGRYFKRSQSLSDVPVTQDSDASTIATELLAKYKDPMQRVTQISPKMADANTAFAVYKLDLMQRIEVLRRPPGGGSAVDQQVFIQSIHHSGEPGVPPTCTLTVSPL